MRRKLLLADDSVTIQRVIELTFADEPVDVATVGDGAAAIARLDAEPPDVVLADIGMPGHSGYDVAMHVRRTPALAHIPVILLTGAFDPVDHARVRAAGCAGVLVKPFDPQMLIVRVRQLLSTPSAAPAAADNLRVEARADQVAAEAPADDAPALQPGTEINAAASVRVRQGFDVESTADRKTEDQSAPSAGAGPQSSVESRPADARATEVEEYFDRLDRAFAELQSAAPGAPRVSSPGTEDSADTAAAFTAPAPAAGAVSSDNQPPVEPIIEAATSVSGPAATATLGDAFAALLAIEQGQPVPAGTAWASILHDDLVPQIAARVSHAISERVIRELAPEIVSRVAERIVRDEIERLKVDRLPQ
jgi:CheY-like chemotaxis protein